VLGLVPVAAGAAVSVDFSDQSASFVTPVANPLVYPTVSFSSANGLRVFSFPGFLDKGLCPHANNACRSEVTLDFSKVASSISFDVLQVDETDSVLAVQALTAGGNASRSVALTRGFNVNRVTLDLSGVTQLVLDGTSDEEGVIYDNFLFDQAISAVPEPAGWALMIAGFGLAGAAARGRRRIALA
jgi:hypothetical protein